MGNSLDEQYIDLLKDILKNGAEKDTRNGKTKSVFGRTIRHKMSEGFPLLTTKKMYLKGIVTELLWFLRGDTNIQWLCQNNCNIWVGDTYKVYCNNWDGRNRNSFTQRVTLEDGTVGGTSRRFTEKEFIEKIKTDDEFAKKHGDLGPIYGAQWRNWTALDRDEIKLQTYGIDQIQVLLNDLRTNPDSRRLMVSAWNPADLPEQVLPPCHFGFQVYTRELGRNERYKLLKERFTPNREGFKIREMYQSEMDYYDMNGIPKRAISLAWNQRSCDTFLGIPYNITSYGLLLMLLGEMVNMVPDELIGNLGDTHLYRNHIEQAKEQIGRASFPLPKMNINTEFWLTESGECGIGDLNHNLDSLLMGIELDDFWLENYISHETIKAPLSN